MPYGRTVSLRCLLRASSHRDAVILLLSCLLSTRGPHTAVRPNRVYVRTSARRRCTQSAPLDSYFQPDDVLASLPDDDLQRKFEARPAEVKRPRNPAFCSDSGGARETLTSLRDEVSLGRTRSSQPGTPVRAEFVVTPSTQRTGVRAARYTFAPKSAHEICTNRGSSALEGQL